MHRQNHIEQQNKTRSLPWRLRTRHILNFRRSGPAPAIQWENAHRVETTENENVPFTNWNAHFMQVTLPNMTEQLNVHNNFGRPLRFEITAEMMVQHSRTGLCHFTLHEMTQHLGILNLSVIETTRADRKFRHLFSRHPWRLSYRAIIEFHFHPPAEGITPNHPPTLPDLKPVHIIHSYSNNALRH